MEDEPKIDRAGSARPIVRQFEEERLAPEISALVYDRLLRAGAPSRPIRSCDRTEARPPADPLVVFVKGA